MEVKSLTQDMKDIEIYASKVFPIQKRYVVSNIAYRLKIEFGLEFKTSKMGDNVIVTRTK